MKPSDSSSLEAIATLPSWYGTEILSRVVFIHAHREDRRVASIFPKERKADSISGVCEYFYIIFCLKSSKGGYDVKNTFLNCATFSLKNLDLCEHNRFIFLCSGTTPY